jgi:CRISPR/Cas system-associated exonuclease Cas4 (RecB family)
MIKRTKNYIKEIDYEYTYVPDAIRNKFPEYDGRGRMRLSVSRMQLFEKCGLAFKWSYIDRLDLREDDASRERLDKGVSLHDLFYQASFQRNPAIVRSHELYAKFPEHCENFIKLQWDISRSLGDHRPLFAEKEIFDEDDFVVLYVDRINDMGDGTVEIMDYKTGAYHSIKTHQFQLALYTYYVEKHLKLRVSKWSIYYSKDNKYKSMKVDRAKVGMIPEVIRMIREKIDECFSTGSFEKRPNQLCHFCSFMQFGLCTSGAKTYNNFGLLDIFSKSWKEEEDDEAVRYIGGIMVTRQ